MGKRDIKKLLNDQGPRVLNNNRRARHDYEIVEKFEAGVALRGCEVKSLRDGGGSVAEAYIQPRGSELWIVGWYIPPYTHGSAWVEASDRDRKLLLNRRELNDLIGSVSQKGFTIVPLKVYLTERGLVKMEIGLARGKTRVDRRQDIKERTVKRELEREYKVR
ncbi:MAG: SsrA-binding protein SmpB [Sumerlaeia bacterium]